MSRFSEAFKKRQSRARYNIKRRNKSNRPRLSVFISNREVYAQIIVDKENGSSTVCSSSSLKSNIDKMPQKASFVGKEIALKSKDLGIQAVVLDKGGFSYSKLISIISDSARSEGLQF